MVLRFGFEVVSLHGYFNYCLTFLAPIAGKQYWVVPFTLSHLPYCPLVCAGRTHTYNNVCDTVHVVDVVFYLIYILHLCRIDLWNNENLAQDVFLGETRVPVKILKKDHIHKAW